MTSMVVLFLVDSPPAIMKLIFFFYHSLNPFSKELKVKPNSPFYFLIKVKTSPWQMFASLSPSWLALASIFLMTFFPISHSAIDNDNRERREMGKMEQHEGGRKKLWKNNIVIR